MTDRTGTVDTGELPAWVDEAQRWCAGWRYGRVPHIEPLLGARVVYAGLPHRAVDAWIGWGRKVSGLRAQREAARGGLPCLLAEDGFLRSIGLGFRDAALSMVLDDRGIYYDATGPSRLELLVRQPRDEAQLARAARLAVAWRDARVSKYNHAREIAPPLERGFVLVVDQTAGDSSIGYGLADARSFQRMLEAALDEHPGHQIALKVHPDVISGRKAGHFAAMTAGAAARVRLVATDSHAPALFEHAAAVYCVTSQMGFEALLWDKPVRTFGMPFYAGWGLTRDELPAPPRRQAASLPSLVHAALIDYPRYIDPETLRRCEAERLLDWMGLQRRQRERFPPDVHAIDLRGWKRPVARAYFGGCNVHFVSSSSEAPAGSTLAVWGRTGATDETRPCVRLEDGFVRSVGLGADLVHPLSWVMDRSGMYYDASAPSDLETLLATHSFDERLLARACNLRERIVAAGVTKYNVGSGKWQRPEGHRRVILVPGQVETDASILHGSPSVRTNWALLEATRDFAPDAYIVYKPHPDVLAGLRPSDTSLAANVACPWDERVDDVPIHLLLEQVDEVHTLTSLAGFEALLRGKRVVCHGSPFYAGWGLTADRLLHPRRGRKLTLDALVAGTLILYPTYISRVTGKFTSPERAIDEVQAWREQAMRPAGAWSRLLRPLRSRCIEWVDRWRHVYE